MINDEDKIKLGDVPLETGKYILYRNVKLLTNAMG